MHAQKLCTRRGAETTNSVRCDGVIYVRLIDSGFLQSYTVSCEFVHLAHTPCPSGLRLSPCVCLSALVTARRSVCFVLVLYVPAGRPRRTQPKNSQRSRSHSHASQHAHVLIVLRVAGINIAQKCAGMCAMLARHRSISQGCR